MTGTLAALIAACLASAASAHQWVGMTPDYAKGTIELFTLTGYAARGPSVSTIPIGAAERVDVDSFRCRPYGNFCLVTTTDRVSNSWLYNVSVADGSLNSKTAIPGAILHNLHLDKATGGAYSVALTANTTKIVMIFDGQTVDLIDLTPYVAPAETVPVGGTTQCSNTDEIWVGIKAAAKGASDRIISAKLRTRNVSGVLELKDPLPVSLWAHCDNSNNVDTLAGAVQPEGGSTIAYAALSATGQYELLEQASLPAPGLVLSGLLSQPPTWSYFMTMYPPGAEPGSNATGFAAFGHNNAGPALTVQPIDYYLTGAAALS